MRILWIDTNLALQHAIAVGQAGHDVDFYIWRLDAFPRFADTCSGLGFPELHKVWDLGESLDRNPDLIIFSDVGLGDMANWLRSDGFDVFGTDSKTQRLELDRHYFYETARSLGLKTPNYELVHGIDSLMNKIEQAGGRRWIKLNRFRGDVETFPAESKADIMLKVGKSGLIAIADELDWLVQEDLSGAEIGVDAFFDGRQFADVVFETIERIGNFTVAVPIDRSIWLDILTAFEPVLARNGYRGIIGLEGFLQSDGSIILTDFTARFPFICSLAYPFMIDNYADFLISIGMGDADTIKLRATVSLQSRITTDDLQAWTKIRPGNHTAIQRAIRRQDGQILIPPMNEIVAVPIGIGFSLAEAIADIRQSDMQTDAGRCESQVEQTIGMIAIRDADLTKQFLNRGLAR